MVLPSERTHAQSDGAEADKKSKPAWHVEAGHGSLEMLSALNKGTHPSGCLAELLRVTGKVGDLPNSKDYRGHNAHRDKNIDDHRPLAEEPHNSPDDCAYQNYEKREKPSLGQKALEKTSKLAETAYGVLELRARAGLSLRNAALRHRHWC